MAEIFRITSCGRDILFIKSEKKKKTAKGFIHAYLICKREVKVIHSSIMFLSFLDINKGMECNMLNFTLGEYVLGVLYNRLSSLYHDPYYPSHFQLNKRNGK